MVIKCFCNTIFYRFISINLHPVFPGYEPCCFGLVTFSLHLSTVYSTQTLGTVSATGVRLYSCIFEYSAEALIYMTTPL